jgi:hypothetical protein
MIRGYTLWIERIRQRDREDRLARMERGRRVGERGISRQTVIRTTPPSLNLNSELRRKQWEQ